MTNKQKMFCQEYIIDFNATQAAIRAGYSKKSARLIGHENITKLYIQAEINKQIDKRIERVEVRQDRIIYELAKIAFADIGNFVDIDGDKIKIRDLTDLDTSVLSEASETITTAGHKLKIKLYDKIKPLEMLGKHLKMFTDNLNIEGNVRNVLKIKDWSDDDEPDEEIPKHGPKPIPDTNGET